MAQQAQGNAKHCFVNQRVPIRAYTADTQQYGKWALICSAQPVDNKAVTLGLTVDIVQQVEAASNHKAGVGFTAIVIRTAVEVCFIIDGKRTRFDTAIGLEVFQ